jgi:hypothetical protein
MAYKVEKKGYVVKGFFLGQRVMSMEHESIIIGFDEDCDTNLSFICVKRDERSAIPISDSKYVTVGLEGEEDSRMSWEYARDVIALEACGENRKGWVAKNDFQSRNGLVKKDTFVVETTTKNNESKILTINGSESKFICMIGSKSQIENFELVDLPSSYIPQNTQVVGDPDELVFSAYKLREIHEYLREFNTNSWQVKCDGKTAIEMCKLGYAYEEGWFIPRSEWVEYIPLV